ncbi:hypothetical protein [Halomontanus rarus]|uniref:exo-rhamnogalacturonan lyase family protein n=1 Tax=Halomontanus rarus TaxID=3034020 RepID=UPI0023E87ACE|nr:hypothetical protein [Halovivax sp. TS33]
MSASGSDSSVALRVLWPHEFTRDDEWAVGGVPFHRGELAVDDAANLSVRTDDGSVHPIQTRVLAYWPDDSVKWLLVITRCEVVADEEAGLRLVRESATPSGAAVTADRTDDAIVVDTGAMTFRIPLETSALLESVVLDGRELLQPDDLPELFVDVEERADDENGVSSSKADADGERSTRYTDRDAGTYRTVEVEEDGPCRATVKITGTHVAADGSTFAPYTVRLSAFAGERAVRVSHTFVYDGDPKRDLIRSLGVRVPVAVDSPPTYGYGGSVPPATRSAADRREDWEMAWSTGELVQETPTSYRFEKRVDPETPPVTIERNDKSEGWVDLSNDAGGLAVAVRDAWQNAPTSLRMDADAGEVTAFLWPDSSEPLDLEWYSDTAYGQLYESPGTPCRQNSPRIPTMDAHGISKTHDLQLSFHAGDVDDRELSERARAFDDRPQIAVAPERYAETEVLGTYAATAPSEYEKQEEWFEQGLDYMLQEQDRRGWYGMFDYGDVIRSYDHETHQWGNDRGGHGWLNTEFQPDQWLWYTFLRTGRYDAFRFAEAMARHTTDVDVLHVGPWWGFGSRHGVQHWSDGDREIRVSMPGGRRIHYYLTGDERSRDVIELAVRRYQTMQRERGRTWMGFDEEMYVRTDVTAALYAYYVAWEMTGDEKYETLVRNLVENIYCDLHPKGLPYNRARVDLSTGEGEPVGEDGLSSNMFLQFGGLHLLTELADSGDFPELSEAMLSYADYQLLPYEERAATGDNAGRGHNLLLRSMPLHAFAYRETGGEDHREALEEALDEREITLEPAPWDEDLILCVDGVGSPPCSLAAFGRKAPYAFAALDADPDGEEIDADER